MSARNLTCRLLAAAVALAAVPACGSASAARSGSTAPTTAVAASTVPTTAGVSPTTSVSPADGLLEDLTLSQNNVRVGVKVVPFPSTPNLPNWGVCEGPFAVQAQLAARRWVGAVQSGTEGPPLFSTEADLFKSPDAGVTALTEIEKAISTCPRTAITSPYLGGESNVETFLPYSPSAQWPQTPGVERLAVQMHLTFGDGSSSQVLYVYLARSDVLLFLDFGSTVSPAGSGPTASEDFDSWVQFFSKRLAAAALPEAS